MEIEKIGDECEEAVDNSQAVREELLGELVELAVSEAHADQGVASL